MDELWSGLPGDTHESAAEPGRAPRSPTHPLLKRSLPRHGLEDSSFHAICSAKSPTKNGTMQFWKRSSKCWLSTSPPDLANIALNADNTLVNRCSHLKAEKRVREAAKVQGTRGPSLRKGPDLTLPRVWDVEGKVMGRMWTAHRDEAPSPSLCWAVTNYMSGQFAGDWFVFVQRDKHCLPQAPVLLFHLNAVFYRALLPGRYSWFLFRGEQNRILSLRSLQFSSNRIFQLLIESQYSSPFPPGKPQTLQRVKKEFARFQAPSLPIGMPGLIWVSKHKAKVPITRRHIPQIKQARDYTSPTACAA